MPLPCNSACFCCLLQKPPAVWDACRTSHWQNYSEHLTFCFLAGCYSLARLLDEGVVAGCEGDVCSALGMLWGKLMTAQVPWMANIAQVRLAGGACRYLQKRLFSSVLIACLPTSLPGGLPASVPGGPPARLPSLGQ